MSVAGFVRGKTLNAREEGDKQRSSAWKQVASVGTGMNGRGGGSTPGSGRSLGEGWQPTPEKIPTG